MLLDHIGVAVTDVTAAAAAYALLGFSATEAEDVPLDQVRVVMLPLTNGGRIELLQPLSEESPVARFLQRHGPGLHHVAFRVTDIHATLEAVAAAGLAVIDTAPRPGAGGQLVAFLHPRSLGGVLIELCERGEGQG